MQSQAILRDIEDPPTVTLQSLERHVGRPTASALAFRRLIFGCGMAGLVTLTPAVSLPPARIERGQLYSEAHKQLLDLLAAARPTEARVVGEAYGPYGLPRRAFRSATVSPDSFTHRGGVIQPRPSIPRNVVHAIEAAAHRDPSPENQATLAVLRLSEGRPADAVGWLRQAQARKPQDSRLLNDLAAALLALSDQLGEPWPVLEAVDAARRSLQSSVSHAALFNHALALERLGLRARSSIAWRRYLSFDSTSPWAAEASQRLSRLQVQIDEARNGPAARGLRESAAAVHLGCASNAWATRQRGERILLPRWAGYVLSGREIDAESVLEEAAALARSCPAGGGRLLSDSIAAIRQTEGSGNRARLHRLALGHQELGEAFRLAREERRERAFQVVESAIQDLEAAGSPFALRAGVLRALISPEPDWIELRRLLEAGREYPSVAADAQFIAASRISQEGRLAEALVVYQDARDRFERIDESEMSPVISAMLAELLDALGRKQEAGMELARALSAGYRTADPWNRYSILVVAASASFGQASPAAVEMRLEAATVCHDLPEKPLCTVDSWLWAANLTPDAELAERAMEQAGTLLPGIPDSDGKRRTAIDLLTARGRMRFREELPAGDWEDASDLYLEAAAEYERMGLGVSAARARAERAGILHRLGRRDEAATEYRAGLAALRKWDAGERFRLGSAEGYSPRELRQVFEGLIELELEAQRDPNPAAFLLSEEMRDRSAPLRRTEPWIPTGEDLERFLSRVPEGTAVIEYAVLDRQVVAWILAAGRFIQVPLVPSGSLAERILELQRQDESVDVWKAMSATLFADLLAPVLARLPPATKRLAVIPDSELYGLPFRALWNPESSRYLDEDFAITLSPSVRQFLDSGKRNEAGGALASILSLGIGSFDATLGLKILPWAEAEAAEVRERYAGLSLETCPDSDWEQLLPCLQAADIVHLATHAAADLSRSSWTWLALRRETVGLDRLWRELPDLPRRPLIVLSACQSVAAAGGGEGLGGLARPFLASGARAVVGTLWKIRDEEAARFFPELHQAFLETGDVPEALKMARENLQDWPEKPWIWGAVESIGAFR